MSAIRKSTSAKAAIITGPCSVNLKFNSSSVMLYRNHYVKSKDGKGGMTTQQYVCSFPNRLTEIPTDFHQQLQQATAGQPQRYQELIRAIETRVLEPARKVQEQKNRLADLEQMRAWLNFGQQQVHEAASCAQCYTYASDPKIQQSARLILQDVQHVLVLAREAEREQQPEQTAPDATQADARLRQLLYSINRACAEIQAMLPVERNQFPRGYEFDERTVREVQQMWFNTSDTIAALNQRQQFKRSSGWTDLRPTVMALAGEKSVSL
ncbi:MAG: hypothetical protein K2Y10_11555 [Burkholderiaceae bacterium]|nr:hypothetical protein [Burkholderiaceae bacterium]